MAQTSPLAWTQSPLPGAGEEARLAALRRYEVLDTPPEQGLDDLAGLAAQLCEAPLALITLVDERRQWFKAKVRLRGRTAARDSRGDEVEAPPAGGGDAGRASPPDALDGDELPRDLSFCGHAILQSEVFMVPDAADDERFARNPQVMGAPHIRFYAGAPLLTADGHALGTLCIMDHVPRRLNPAQREALRALSRQVMAQLELRLQTRELRLLAQRLTLATDAASIGVWDWDRSGGQIYASPVCSSMLGYPPDRGVTDLALWLSRVHPDDQTAASEKVRAAVAGVEANALDHYEARMRHADGSYRWISVVGRVLTVDGQRNATRLIGVGMDITEGRRLDEQLRQSQRMDAIGQLAGGVAHDFNNILGAIMMQTALAADVPDQPTDARDLLMEIKSATERATNLTRQLLAFGRRQVMQRRLLNLNDIVTNRSKMLEQVLGEDVHLELKLRAGGLPTRADAGMLDQVLLNLAMNARDAMPHGGQVIIETEERSLTKEERAVTPDASPGRHVCLRLTDTGSGIGAKHLPRIFEPFYTTKEPGKGTGLGLATVFGIVKQHGGWVAVQTEVGRGSTFEIFLPASDWPDSVAQASPGGGKIKPRGGTETILLVEDEAMVRRLRRLVLEGAGYQVLEAANGVEALTRWDEHHRSIKLLLTDVLMPGGVSGPDLARRLHACDPRLRIILTSGFNSDVAGEEPWLTAAHNFLQKPSTAEHLLETVRQCLDA
ncbi:MAG: ATP-binding protein [Myxococcales bacterium]